ncbi:hypothetical protein MNBD_BACTEROID05-669 [hydrothermal vent metagenome]|uniref:Membrane protein 6-pyruvoyl-tetrahydropterin synthase-related domain-containing protein n=1 Tax=hydrothermal vent metagenome TaxID=652676 RepID=A0A3B0TLZ3_9ZZZZ
MRTDQTIQTNPESKNNTFFVGLLFAVWVFCFRGFFLGKLAFDSDAISYYNHIKFFIDNLLQGVYPLWDPTWNTGVPNEFFLRRFNGFNPLYGIILVLRKIGLPHLTSYLIFLASYYFIGMSGFYLLAKRLYRNVYVAYVSCGLLLFSSLGTRLFDSYMLLITVPLIWFFYYLTAFTQDPKKVYFVGLIFSVMILLTTYIPFYFLTIFLTFLFCFVLLYFRRVKEILSRYLQFFKGQKILVVVCLVALLASLVPGLMFFNEVKSTGELSLPQRHSYAQSETGAIEVGIETITSWGILEDIVYSSVFTDFRKFKFAIIYIPVFGFLLFFAGIFTKVSRKVLFLFVWGIILFIINSPHTPIYHFLHENLFYYSYFRNLHFFLWFALLPILILFLSGQFNALLECSLESDFKKGRAIILVGAFHLGMMFLIARYETGLVTSYVVLSMSMIFSVLYIQGWFLKRKGFFLFALFLVLSLQPVEVYTYLNKNAVKSYGPYRYDRPYLGFSFDRGGKNEITLQEAYQSSPPSLYVATRWYQMILAKIPFGIVRKYMNHKWKAYDQVSLINDSDFDSKEVSEGLFHNENMAYVHEERAMQNLNKSLNIAPWAQTLTAESDDFKVLKYDVNQIKVKTNFSQRKFLVYNDSYHSKWKAFVNGKEVDLVRANIGFKGLWVSAGENVVYLRYGTRQVYYLNWALMALFYGLFGYLILLTVKGLSRYE